MARDATGRTESRSPAWRLTSHPTLAASGLATEKILAPLFTDGWRPDDRLPVVRKIHDMCMARLRRV